MKKHVSWIVRKYQQTLKKFMDLSLEEAMRIYTSEVAPLTPCRNAYWLGCRKDFANPHVKHSIAYAAFEAGRKRKAELAQNYVSEYCF